MYSHVYVIYSAFHLLSKVSHLTFLGCVGFFVTQKWGHRVEKVDKLELELIPLTR